MMMLMMMMLMMRAVLPVAPCSFAASSGRCLVIPEGASTMPEQARLRSQSRSLMETRRADMLHTSPSHLPLPPSSALLQVNFEAPKRLLPTPPVKGQ
jgi:hypothetical protein